MSADEARLFSRLGYEDLGYETESEFEAYLNELIPLAGLVSAYLSYSYEETVIWLTTSGLMLWIEFAGKSIVRRLWA